MSSTARFFGALERREKYDLLSKQGGTSSYTHYREVIAEDCRYRCVYCDSHQDTIGGPETMQLDHFRPWNRGFGPEKVRHFAHLVDDPKNLVHACSVCNRFKAARWPTEDPDVPHDDEKGWVDPFAEVRSDFLFVEANGSLVEGKPPGNYLIRTLRLNRPLLMRQRELRSLVATLEEGHIPRLRGILESNADSEHAQTALLALALFDTIRSQCCPD